MGRRCYACGTPEKYLEAGKQRGKWKCSNCIAYTKAIAAGRVVGIDNRSPHQKVSGVKRVAADWSPEMSAEHSRAIKLGKQRSKRIAKKLGSIEQLNRDYIHLETQFSHLRKRVHALETRGHAE